MTVCNPQAVQVTLSITTSLKEWEELLGQLSQQYPSWALSAIINKALADVQRVHRQEQEYQAP